MYGGVFGMPIFFFTKKETCWYLMVLYQTIHAVHKSDEMILKQPHNNPFIETLLTCDAFDVA